MRIKEILKSFLANGLCKVYESINRKYNCHINNMIKRVGDINVSETLRCTVAYNKYGGYCVPLSSNSRPAAKKVLNNKIYEPQTIEFIMNHCKKGDIVHAGTYFGDFLPAISSACHMDAKVWAFEPNPENFRCAEITLLINKLENVVLTNAGLGEKEENLYVKTQDDLGNALGGASKIMDQTSGGKTKTVQIVTIDTVIPQEREVSILQLDIEGYEEYALKGAMETIKRSRPILILEDLQTNTLFSSVWFKENILALGYEMIESLHSNKVFICK